MSRSLHITTVTVPLGKRTYPIYIGSRLLQRAGHFFRRRKISGTVVIVTDSTVAKLYLTPLYRSLTAEKYNVHTIVIPPGERQKSSSRTEKIYTQLLRWKIERSSTIVALGGGVIGDLAGFIAATYQRGIGFVQIPTTLLAQVDSSVGGKVGINHPLAKNMIGAFYQPQFVLADCDVLSSLPTREIVCGLGEIVKYGIILDKKFFDSSAKDLKKAMKRDAAALRAMVKRSCELKAYVVSNDEREHNLRAILNFGHTVGHALEHAGRYSHLKHGEAILYGMVAEAHIAYSVGLLSLRQKEKIEQTIKNIPLPRLSRTNLKIESLIKTMKVDKKVKDGEIYMALPNSIGTITLPMPVDEDMIEHSIHYLADYAS